MAADYPSCLPEVSKLHLRIKPNRIGVGPTEQAVTPDYVRSTKYKDARRGSWIAGRGSRLLTRNIRSRSAKIYGIGDAEDPPDRGQPIANVVMSKPYYVAA